MDDFTLGVFSPGLLGLSIADSGYPVGAIEKMPSPKERRREFVDVESLY